MDSKPTLSSRQRGRRFAIVALVIAAAAFAVITVGGIGENLVYYWGPSELREAGDRAVGASIRLGGQVRKGSIAFEPRSSDLQFDVTDGRSSVHVRSSGVPPQMFREGIGVVVEGTMNRGGYFASNRLMISHNNEYRAPGEKDKVDARKLMKTTEGLKKESGAAD